MRGFVRSLIVMHQCQRGIRGELASAKQSKSLTHSAAFNQTRRSCARSKIEEESGSIVNAAGQECQDAVGRLAKYEPSVTQRAQFTAHWIVQQIHQLKKRSNANRRETGGRARAMYVEIGCLLAPDMLRRAPPTFLSPSHVSVKLLISRSPSHLSVLSSAFSRISRVLNIQILQSLSHSIFLLCSFQPFHNSVFKCFSHLFKHFWLHSLSQRR